MKEMLLLYLAWIVTKVVCFIVCHLWGLLQKLLLFFDIQYFTCYSFMDMWFSVVIFNTLNGNDTILTLAHTQKNVSAL